VVSLAAQALYRRELDQMFSRRTAHFRDQLGWPLGDGTRPGERDAGDDDQALYLLALEADGLVSASLRVRPTRDWSLLAGPAAALAPEARDLDAPDVWELSRLLLPPLGPGRPGRVRPFELRLALLEEACDHGIRRIVGLAEGLAEAVLMRSGLPIRKLGPTQPFGRALAFAFEIEVGPQALAALHAREGEAQARRLRLPPIPDPGGVSPLEMEEMLEAARRLEPVQLRALITALRQAGDEEN